MDTRDTQSTARTFFPGTIIIFEHPASCYRYSPELDIYRIQDSRFYDISLYYDLNAFGAVFNENFENALQSNKPIITIGYNSMIAKTVKVCLEKFFTGFSYAFPMISFFHDDRDTAKIDYGSKENPLDDKMFVLLDMLNYPFIKKFEIPYDEIITPALLLENLKAA